MREAQCPLHPEGRDQGKLSRIADPVAHRRRRPGFLRQSLVRYRPDLGQLGCTVRRLQEALSASRDDLQRYRLRRDRGGTREGAQPPAGRHGLLLRGLGGGRCQEGRGRAVQAGEFRQAAGRVPRSRGQVVHHPLADHRIRGEHQADQERAAVVGRSAQARIQERGGLSRPALDRGRAGAGIRDRLCARRQRRQRSARHRLSRQTAQGRQRAAVVGTTPYAQFVRARSRSGFRTRTTA